MFISILKLKDEEKPLVTDRKQLFLSMYNYNICVFIYLRVYMHKNIWEETGLYVH